MVGAVTNVDSARVHRESLSVRFLPLVASASTISRYYVASLRFGLITRIPVTVLIYRCFSHRITADRPNSFAIFHDQRPSHPSPLYRWLINVRPDEQSGNLFARLYRRIGIPKSIPISDTAMEITRQKRQSVQLPVQRAKYVLHFIYAIYSHSKSFRRTKSFISHSSTSSFGILFYCLVARI